VASEAFEKFQRSMNIGYAEWHDGIGYDLDAISALPPDERLRAEDLVVNRRLADWRDIEALDRFGSERALAEMEKALGVKSLDVRIEAAQRLARRGAIKEAEIERVIVNALNETTILNGMVKTLRFATANPTPTVLNKLLWCTLHGNDDLRVHAAALVHYLHGGSSSDFDWAFRPFYLQFGSKDPRVRRAAYLELCAKIGVKPEE
jgi:hypothetical protein